MAVIINFLCLKIILNRLYQQNAALCCIASGSSLFAKYSFRGLPNMKLFILGTVHVYTASLKL